MNLTSTFSCNYTGVYADFFNEGFLSLKALNHLFGIEDQVEIAKYLDDVVFVNYPNLTNKKKALIADLKVVRRLQAERAVFYFKNTNAEGESVFFYPIRSNSEDDYLFLGGVENDERFFSLIEEESKYIVFNLMEINMKRDKPNIAYFNCLGNRLIEEYPLIADGFKDLFVTNDAELQKRKQKQKIAQNKILSNIAELNTLKPQSMTDFCNFFIIKGYVICLQNESFSVFDSDENINLTLHEFIFNEELEPFTIEKLLSMIQFNHQSAQFFFYQSLQNKKIENIIEEPTIQYMLAPQKEELKQIEIPQVPQAQKETEIPQAPQAQEETEIPQALQAQEEPLIQIQMNEIIQGLLSPNQLQEFNKIDEVEKIAYLREIAFDTEEKNVQVETVIIRLEKIAEVSKKEKFEFQKTKLTHNVQNNEGEEENLIEEQSPRENVEE